jgi:hypothetical protein
MVEGYVLHVYGAERYLRQAVASALTIRRHDSERAIALYAEPSQIESLESNGLCDLFDVVEPLPEAHRSIVGFKHHLERFMPFDRCLFVDADMVWCRDPEPLWAQFRAHTFTATGVERADMWFGGPKGLGVLKDWLLDRRRRTMRHFGLTYLPRVQAGMIYASDAETTAKVCRTAREFLSRRKETHFRSRLSEGRSEESCEWSLAMAMSRLDLPIVHWFQGQISPQLDYVEGWVDHDDDFLSVSCLYFNDPTVHSLRGIPSPRLRRFATGLASRLPGRGDRMRVTPFALHFGWLRYKDPFLVFADRSWRHLVAQNRERRVTAEAAVSAG